MIFKRNKPVSWLKQLSEVLENAQCRENGTGLSFDAGIEKLGKIFLNSAVNGAFVWWAANGGSAAVCSHLSQDLMNKVDVKSLFCSDPSLITCMANDFGYDQVYTIPLKKMASAGDTLIAISSSGNSDNIVNAAKVAVEKKMNLVTLSGFEKTNRLFSLGKGLSFYLPSFLYGIVEVGHEALIHSVIESLWLENKDTHG